MNRFFHFDEQLLPFVFYSLSHTVALGAIFAVCVSILLTQNLLQRKKNADRIRHMMAGILLTFDIGLYVWYGTSGQWDPAYSLPLHLCSLTLVLAIVMLWTRSYALFEFVYFAGIGGALQALLTPAAILSGYPHYTFYYFFVAHGGIIASCLLMIAGYGFRPSWRSIVRSMIYLNVLLLPIALVNRLTGGNYLFIAHKPADPSMIDFLGPWPWYIISMELVALTVFILLYLPFLRRLPGNP